MLAAGTRAGFDELPVTVNDVAGGLRVADREVERRRRRVFVSRLVRDVGNRRRVIDCVTVSTKLSLAVPPSPSVTVSVIVAVPD